MRLSAASWIQWYEQTASIWEKRLLGTQVAHFFPQPLARQRLLDPLLFTRLQIERVFLCIFDNIFLLNLPLEAPQSAFQGFTFIQNNFRQSLHLLNDEGISLSRTQCLSRPNLLCIAFISKIAPVVTYPSLGFENYGDDLLI